MQHITIGDATTPDNKAIVDSAGRLVVTFAGVTNSVYSEVLVAVGVTPTELFSTETTRRKVNIQNFSEAGTNDIVFYGIAAGTTGQGKGIALMDGDSADFDDYTGDLRGILTSSAAAGVTMRILEKF